MEEGEESRFLESQRGQFRRHSSAVGMNGFHRRPLELYLIRISPPCRVVWLYLLQHRIPHILVDIDFSKGEDRLPESIRNQPHREVPIVIDGDLVIFDGPAILSYLACNYTQHAGYGLTLQQRMTCESLISWANSEVHRAVGYNYIYPQFLDRYNLPCDSANEILVESGLKQLSRILELLEKHYLAKSRFLLGNRITVADSFIASILVQVEWTGTRIKLWPKVDTWLSRVKNQENWDTVHFAHNAYVKDLEAAALLH